MVQERNVRFLGSPSRVPVDIFPRAGGLPNATCIDIRPADPIQREVGGFAVAEHRATPATALARLIVCAQHMIDVVRPAHEGGCRL